VQVRMSKLKSRSKSKRQLVPLTLALSPQGRESQEVRLPRPDKSGLAMTGEVPAPVENRTNRAVYDSLVA